MTIVSVLLAVLTVGDVLLFWVSTAFAFYALLCTFVLWASLGAAVHDLRRTRKTTSAPDGYELIEGDR